MKALSLSLRCRGLGLSFLLFSPLLAQSAVLVAFDGIDLGNRSKSYLFNLKPIDVVADFSEASWTGPWSSTLAVPAANLTGIKSDGSLVSRASLLPLKPQGITITAQDNTTITTLIDHQGTRTSSLVTSGLYLVNPANQQPVELAKIVNGAVTFPNAVFPSSGNLTLPTTLNFASGGVLTSAYHGSLLLDGGYDNSLTAERAVVLGGRANRATGEGSVVIGGFNYAGYENRAAGTGSTIIGSGASRAVGAYSSIIGGNGIHMLGVNANYNTVVGGVAHSFGEGSGSYNAVIGGYGHRFESGGHVTFIGGGESHTIRNGGWRLALLGGTNNTLENVMGATIIGGLRNQIRSTNFNDNENLSVVIGGQDNVIIDTSHSIILGGGSNQTTAYSSATLVAQGGRATGSNQVVTGRYNKVDSSQALIIGNGISDATRRDAFTVDFGGNVKAAGSIDATGTVKADSLEVKTFRITSPQGNIPMGAFSGD